MPRTLSRIAMHAILLLCASGSFAALSGLVFAAPAHAVPQHKGHSTLSGVVIGPDDKPAPHASITYQSSFGAMPHAVHADARGRFSIAHLEADNYDLRASSKGIFSEWVKNVTLQAGETKSITLRLMYSRAPLKNKKYKN
ncbi:MAG: carboxypeptidase-like regulatory domain-containing protein [Acidobacteriia bacterium]|nr:carboxypeptidase-like regulatory domain-containing protein [Terriglobia bacterium]